MGENREMIVYEKQIVESSLESMKSTVALWSVTLSEIVVDAGARCSILTSVQTDVYSILYNDICSNYFALTKTTVSHYFHTRDMYIPMGCAYHESVSSQEFSACDLSGFARQSGIQAMSLEKSLEISPRVSPYDTGFSNLQFSDLRCSARALQSIYCAPLVSDLIYSRELCG